MFFSSLPSPLSLVLLLLLLRTNPPFCECPSSSLKCTQTRAKQQRKKGQSEGNASRQKPKARPKHPFRVASEEEPIKDIDPEGTVVIIDVETGVVFHGRITGSERKERSKETRGLGLLESIQDPQQRDKE